MIIDVHTHVVPEHFPPGAGRASAQRWPLMDHFQPGRARVMIGGKNFRTVTHQCWSHTQRVSDIAREGGDVQVLSPMPELLSYWFTPQDALDFGRYVNEYIAGMVHAAPDHFYGLGMVPLQDPDLAAKELATIKGMGLAGVEIGSNVLGKSLGSAEFLPFFQEVERQDLAVFVHALHPTMTDRILPPTEQLVNAVGFPTDTGLTIASLITGKVLEACPKLRLAFSHGGGTFPFFLPRLQHAWSGRWNDEAPLDQDPPRPLRELLPRSPAEYARRLYYDTLLFDRRAVRYLVEMMGSTQVVVGTDYPFVPREQPISRTLLSMGLDEEQVEDITWRNCLRFLGVKAPASRT